MDLSGYITSSEARLQEVERAISAFDFTKGDQNQYQQLNREYQKIKSLMVVWNDYQKVPMTTSRRSSRRTSSRWKRTNIVWTAKSRR